MSAPEALSPSLAPSLDRPLPVFDALQVGDALPGRDFTPDIVQSFLYNAALWNAHRIHYELDYARDAEGYPGLVLAGPQMGDWMAQCVDDWAREAADLVRIEYSNRQAAYIGDTVTTGGEITAIDRATREVTIALFVRNANGEVLTPGTAVLRFAEATP